MLTSQPEQCGFQTSICYKIGLDFGGVLSHKDGQGILTIVPHNTNGTWGLMIYPAELTHIVLVQN